MKMQSSNTKLIYDLEFDQKSRKRYICPECASMRKNNNAKDLEFYPDTQRAFCFHCNSTLYEHKPFEPKKEYTKPEWSNKTQLSDKAVKYFNSRMISQESLIKLKIYTAKEWMPQYKKEVECICFPYFRGKELINVKFRAPEKKFKVVSNAELIWYNFNAISENKDIIICEGEIDALTFIETGFNNVISVPNGAKNFGFIDDSIECFNHIERIYLATDMDSPGIELKDELIRRFGAERCLTLNYKGAKDANEYFQKVGGLEFKDIIKNALAVPIVGNIEIGSMYNDILDLYENGIKQGLKVDQPEIDDFCTWELGRLCIVTGIPSSGKSEFVDHLICRLNVLHGWKAAFFTPENYPLKYHYAKIHEKISGSKFRKYGNETDFENTFDYIKDNFFYILNEDDLTIESVLKSAKSFVKQRGIKILVIDPYNKLDHQMKNRENETSYVSRFLDEIIKFARFNNVLVFLVAHPVKMQKGDVPTLYNISGSANFYNKTDYGLTVHRELDEQNKMLDSVEVHWQKIKFKHLGKQGVSLFQYNKENGRFDPNGVSDRNNWLNHSYAQKPIEFWSSMNLSTGLTPNEAPF